MNRFKVLLCSDSTLYTQSLAVAFDENQGFETVASVNSNELINAALVHQPDLVVWKLDDAALLDDIIELKKHCPFLLVVVIVEDPNKYDLVQMVKTGIRGCLPIRLLPRQIVNAVELIVNAGILCLPRMNPENLNGHRNGKAHSSLNNLTSREREILSFLGESYSNQEIAAALCLSESTVKTHLRNAFKKLNVRNRTEALAMLLGTEILRTEQPIHS